MEAMELFILTSDRIDDRVVVLTENTYNNIIETINFNYLLIIFTIGCFSSMFCCSKRDKAYRVIPTTEVIEGKIIS